MVHFWVFLSTSNVTVGMARAASFLRTIPDWSKLWIFYWWIFFSNFIWSRDYSSLPIPSSLRNSSKFSLFCNLHSPVATEKCPFIFFVDSVQKNWNWWFKDDNNLAKTFQGHPSSIKSSFLWGFSLLPKNRSSLSKDVAMLFLPLELAYH